MRGVHSHAWAKFYSECKISGFSSECEEFIDTVLDFTWQLTLKLPFEFQCDSKEKYSIT